MTNLLITTLVKILVIGKSKTFFIIFALTISSFKINKMRNKIKQLENQSKLLAPSPEQRQEWNEAVQSYADDFLDQIGTKNAFDASPHLGKNITDLKIGDPKPIQHLLKALKHNVDEVGINPASGKHFGYIPGGGVFPTALGDYLAAVTNRYAGIFFANPGSVRMEHLLLRWMNELVGYPASATGNLASGGSIASLIAITTARDFHQIKARDIENAVIYLTEQVHHCVQKALRIAGLGEAQLRYIPIDNRFRMKVDSLEDLVKADLKQGLKPFLVVSSAGTTDVGAIDPLDAISDVAEKYHLWHHVDAAYGGFFIMADIKNEDGTTLRSQFKGIERSDSLAIDPHKGLFLAYGIGAVLVKNVEALYKSHYYRANYMQDALSATDELSPADLSPELTKHFRALRMWLPLQLYGVAPFKAALEEKIWLARYFYEQVQHLGFEVGPFPDLSVVIFRYVPKSGDTNAFNLKLVEKIREDGRSFVSSTTIEGVFWIRLAVVSFRSHLREVDLFLEILKDKILEEDEEV